MSNIKKEKYMSYILRHGTQSIDLTMDDNGWVLISEFIEKAKYKFNVDIIKDIVESSDKKRFQLSKSELYIKANQGHSITIDLDLKPVKPPIELYHGTAKQFMKSIFDVGIQKQKRHHVHLSTSINTATKVGKRHGVLVLITIDTEAMYADGYDFYISDNGVWLVDEVLPKYFKKTNTDISNSKDI